MPTEKSRKPGDPRPSPLDVFVFNPDEPWLACKDWASGELCRRAGFAGGIGPALIGLILRKLKHSESRLI